MDLGAPPVLPVLRLPEPPVLPRPVLEVPRATLPSYKPLVVPPNNLRPPPGVKGTTQSDERREEKPAPKPVPSPPPKPPSPPSQVRYVDVPGTDFTVPLPSNEILATATTTATVSVAATLTATAVFKRTVSVLKPIIKKLLTKKKKNAQDEELPE
ncbi:hypothetical protein SWQG_00002 [Synechococcus phage S-RIP2]|uniref:Uncharacterized protein n=3 Tax=Sednavirus SRIP2 TaxID=2733955 RepID=M4SNX2_9CAUD|nr:hypothetical protein SWQG_00002 [Synechococcus phage S-RIP2]YP_007676335.1 hypothetical protein CYZG_00013 [Cyanophage KBS-P-1A]AGG91299.1 hypothetical protein SWQG_00002 [Synechococcus phage S-RIP2]AGH57708.1 hypothetical protein CYZG_00013 [Cyanophage KBS-P-1A]